MLLRALRARRRLLLLLLLLPLLLPPPLLLLLLCCCSCCAACWSCCGCRLAMGRDPSIGTALVKDCTPLIPEPPSEGGCDA